MAVQPRQPQRGPGLLWGYLPLLLVAVVIAVLVLVVPSEVPDDTAIQAGGEPAEEPADEGDGAGSGETASGWGGSVEPCEGRELQVDSGYSPPCFSFSGDNGGATHRGVTEDTITMDICSRPWAPWPARASARDPKTCGEPRMGWSTTSTRTSSSTEGGSSSSASTAVEP
jgi:hypothetical protein